MKEVVKEVVLEANVGDPIVSGDAQNIKLGLISSPQFESEFELKLKFSFKFELKFELKFNFLSKFESKFEFSLKFLSEFESKFLPSNGKKVEE